MRRNAGALIGGMLVAAALLAGCTPAVSAPVPSATPTPTAVAFATDAEALAAAEQAIRQYWEGIDRIGAKPEAGADTLGSLVTESQLINDRAGLNALVEAGNHTTGSTAISRIQLQRVDRTGGGVNVMTYVCIDVSALRLVSSDGRDVTPPRNDVQPLQVTLQDRSGHLVLSKVDSWSGASFC